MTDRLTISSRIDGNDMRIGTGFWAKHFSEDMFAGMVDPIVMMDHFHMTSPTFAPHPHAGISAVTYVFEDSIGPHVNHDSIGNHGPIRPGDLHWFVAGRGAVHTEQPEGQDHHVHALQIFVNLPARKKFIEPYAVHVEAADIPQFLADGVRVRVVAGDSQGLRSPAVLPEPFTLLDGFLAPRATFRHPLPPGWNTMIYVVQGKLQVGYDLGTMMLQDKQAVGIGGAPKRLQLTAEENSHFVLLSGPALREPLVKHGPFVMNTPEQIHERIQAYQRGEFGQIDGFAMNATGAS